VNIAWSLDTLQYTALEDQALSRMLDHFCEKRDGSLGIEWITLAAIVEERCLGSKMSSFMDEFRSRVLCPALNFLRQLHRTALSKDCPTELQRFQAWVHQLQVPHLGAAHTIHALMAAGAKCNNNKSNDDRGLAEWVVQARSEVRSVVWWSCPHAAVSSQGVAAWVSANLKVAEVNIDEPGKTFLADDSAEHSILVERMLQPLFLQVARNGHAERRAMIYILRQATRAFTYDNPEAWSDVYGDVKMYASHYLCISCLACVAQFTGRLQHVNVFVEFDNAWSSWEERDAPGPSQSDVFMIGRTHSNN